MQKHGTDSLGAVRGRERGPAGKGPLPLCIEEKKRCERQRQQGENGKCHQ